MTFLDTDNPNYSKADGQLMQQALEEAARKLRIEDDNDPERKVLARFIRAAFLIGNRDTEAMAGFAVDAVLVRRRAAESTSRSSLGNYR
ncbi:MULTISPECIES: hypothetical protein [unclassified Phyllobacterium]|uniref:hypothetical protein n=1 Tax=Phyllobacterium TaxID=28100 RepID=UPI000DD718B5|nr:MULTISPECIES: hypothetical protein [unclassified Phyllobacterium]MBA8900984.1 hypothetical protein [Phyllobacterium sp. P30BS-XVII]UGX87715.1 hypothetical protein LLE53_007855 [Phyllobacterium sp. T1293]